MQGGGREVKMGQTVNRVYIYSYLIHLLASLSKPVRRICLRLTGGRRVAWALIPNLRSGCAGGSDAQPITCMVGMARGATVVRSTELGQISWPQLEGDWIMYGREASDLTGSENWSGKRCAQVKLTEPGAANEKNETLPSTFRRFRSRIHCSKESVGLSLRGAWWTMWSWLCGPIRFVPMWH